MNGFQTPGRLVKTLLDERGWTQGGLALILGLEQSTVSRITLDKRPIDAALALQLSVVFGTPAEDFLSAQQAYDMAKARAETPIDSRLETRARLFGQLPVTEMAKRGWLATDDPGDITKLEAAVARFFGAESPDLIEGLPHAAKKTDQETTVSPVQLAWLYRLQSIAKEMLVPRYSPAAVRVAIEKLKELRTSEHDVRHVPRILGEAGIRFVVVETIGSAKIDGVCLWLNDMAPVIGMTLRHDRIDGFWHTLRHEIEHVLRGHGRGSLAMVDTELQGDRAGVGAGLPEEERVANEAAANFCVPSEKMSRFFTVKAPFFAEIDVVGFAKTVGVHPGLVVGQLQHRTKRYSLYRHHLVKVRSIVTPSSVVDGWGEVYPLAS